MALLQNTTTTRKLFRYGEAGGKEELGIVTVTAIVLRRRAIAANQCRMTSYIVNSLLYSGFSCEYIHTVISPELMPFPSTSTPAFRKIDTQLVTTSGFTPSVLAGNLTVLSHSLASSAE